MNPSFDQLALIAPLLRAVDEAGYCVPTPIQSKAIPAILEGSDVLAAAQTGTGKTAGFTLPILQLLSQHTPHPIRPGRPRALILTPTRELAAQVHQSVELYGKHIRLSSQVFFGGVNINPQINALKKRLDLLVATPGRLLDLMNQGALALDQVEIFVLDEADRMLDMGFIRDIRKILARLPQKRQSLLFSATFSEPIRALAHTLLNAPCTIDVAPRNTTVARIEQSAYQINQKQKRALLAWLIERHQWYQVLVFTRTKHGANRLAEYLAKRDINAAAIHGNKSQGARTRALSGFKSGAVQVLVATDIAARGLDIDQLPQVVNFDLPQVAEDYVHRIGRTGRAGAAGCAISFFDAKEETHLLAAIERLTRQKIDRLMPEDDFVPDQTISNEQHRNAPPRSRSRTPARTPTNAPRGTPPSQRKRPAVKTRSPH